MPKPSDRSTGHPERPQRERSRQRNRPPVVGNRRFAHQPQSYVARKRHGPLCRSPQIGPQAIQKDPNVNVLANEIARQWWEIDVSPINRNHMWLENGMALYAEALRSDHRPSRKTPT